MSCYDDLKSWRIWRLVRAVKKRTNPSWQVYEEMPIDADDEIVDVIEKVAYDAVRGERDKLALKLIEANNRLKLTNSNWPHEKELHEKIDRLEKIVLDGFFKKQG